MNAFPVWMTFIMHTAVDRRRHRPPVGEPRSGRGPLFTHGPGPTPPRHTCHQAAFVSLPMQLTKQPSSSSLNSSPAGPRLHRLLDHLSFPVLALESIFHGSTAFPPQAPPDGAPPMETALSDALSLAPVVRKAYAPSPWYVATSCVPDDAYETNVQCADLRCLGCRCRCAGAKQSAVAVLGVPGRTCGR